MSLGTVTGPTRLRDLAADEFEDRYACDRFTATILSNRFRYIVSHISTHFRTHAFSPIVRDIADMVATLSGGPRIGYAMAAVSETIPLFFGSIPDAVRIALEEYGVERLVPGDVVFVNDYYRVGAHFNDACCIRPVFYRGEVVGAMTIRAHIMDVGGITPGGFSVSKRDTYEDGLRLPPMLLYSAGAPVRSTFQLLNDNSRLGSIVIPDLKTECQSLELGETMLLETIEKYGLDAYYGALRYTCDTSAEAMADALSALPDGQYEGEEWLDGDGLPDSPMYKIRLRIRKVGDRAEFDFRGSSGATRSALNCSWADIKTGMAIALKFLIDPRNPMTSGTFRNIDIVVPPDAPFNPSPPHACMFYNGVVMVLTNVIYKALNPVLGENAKATGWLNKDTPISLFRRPDGTQWWAMTDGTTVDAWGATKDGDGDSGQQQSAINLMFSGVEVSELNSPTLSLGSEYVPDSGGPGYHRGGAAVATDLLFESDFSYHFQHFHGRSPAGGGGVAGGGPGPMAGCWAFDSERFDFAADPFLLRRLDDAYRKADCLGGLIDPETRMPATHGEYVSYPHPRDYAAGSAIRLHQNGGGGWGDPLERDPERVRVDVRDGYVSIAGAAAQYGVVIIGDPDRHPEKLVIDVEATEQARQTRRSSSMNP